MGNSLKGHFNILTLMANVRNVDSSVFGAWPILGTKSLDITSSADSIFILLTVLLMCFSQGDQLYTL